MKRHLSTIVFLLGIGFTAASMYNVFGNHDDVAKDAKVLACGDLGPSCETRTTLQKRTPFSHTYGYDTNKRRVEVHCARVAFLVGPYKCQL